MPSTPKNTLQLLGLAMNIGWQVAVPLVLAAVLGRLADRIWHTSPLFFLIGLIVALLISSWLIVRIVNRVIDSSADNSTDTP